MLWGVNLRVRARVPFKTEHQEQGLLFLFMRGCFTPFRQKFPAHTKLSLPAKDLHLRMPAAKPNFF